MFAHSVEAREATANWRQIELSACVVSLGRPRRAFLTARAATWRMNQAGARIQTALPLSYSNVLL